MRLTTATLMSGVGSMGKYVFIDERIDDVDNWIKDIDRRLVALERLSSSIPSPEALERIKTHMTVTESMLKLEKVRADTAEEQLAAALRHRERILGRRDEAQEHLAITADHLEEVIAAAREMFAASGREPVMPTPGLGEALNALAALCYRYQAEPAEPVADTSCRWCSNRPVIGDWAQFCSSDCWEADSRHRKEQGRSRPAAPGAPAGEDTDAGA